MYKLPAFQLTKSNKDGAEKGEFLSAVLDVFPGADNDPNELLTNGNAVRASITCFKYQHFLSLTRLAPPLVCKTHAQRDPVFKPPFL